MMMFGNELCCFGEICMGKWGLEMMYFEFKFIEVDIEELEEILILVYFIIEGVK